MPSPYSAAVDICNLALTYLGERPIRSIEQLDTDRARTLARVYDSSRQYCMTLGSWTFATKQAAILATDVPLFGFQNAYLLPDDFVSLISVIGDTTLRFASTKYKIMEGKILYDSSEAAIHIEYVFDQTNVRKWSPAFQELVAYHIAKTIGYDVTKKKNAVEMVEAQYKAALMDAVIKDGQDEPPERIERSRALQARLHGSSIWDDPTQVIFDEP